MIARIPKTTMIHELMLCGADMRKRMPKPIVATGEDKELLGKRKKTYEEARIKNPNRWSKDIRNWDHIDTVYLNPADVQSTLSAAA